jgi:hypothetical protein
MLEIACKQQRHPVGIDPPHQGPDLERRPGRRDKAEPNPRTALEGHLGADLRTLRADVQRLTRMTTSPHLDEHRPHDPGSRLLSALPVPAADVTH